MDTDKIAKDFSNRAMANEIKIAILYKEENDGAVKRIAALLGLKRRTVYDYLDGNIKINCRFLHAALIATDGDPDVRKFLEPEGWELVRSAAPIPDKTVIAEECLDDLPALAEYLTLINNRGAKHSDVKRALESVQRELHENYILWCQHQEETH